MFLQSLWIERTTLVTETTLPGILRWSEVISRSVEEIPPVEVSISVPKAISVQNSSYFINFCILILYLTKRQCFL